MINFNIFKKDKNEMINSLIKNWEIVQESKWNFLKKDSFNDISEEKIRDIYTSLIVNNNNINEATLNDTKIGVDYKPTRFGRKYLKKLGHNEDTEFHFSEKNPLGKVLLINPASFRIIDSSDVDNDYWVYKLTRNHKIKWAVARKDLTTKMIKQINGTGSVLRGNHFRETAFLVVFAKLAWEGYGVKIPIYSNRGFIKMDYIDGLAEVSIKNKTGRKLRNEFEEFMNRLPKDINRSYKMQAKELMDYININDISYIVKNSAELLLNRKALELLKDKGLRTTIFKWNPSDIWIVTKGYEFALSSDTKLEKFLYEEYQDIYLEGINTFLLHSIIDKKGVIGISLKQGNKAKLSWVNIEQNSFEYRFISINIKPPKTTYINYLWRVYDEEGNLYDGESTLDIRTFNTNPKSSISGEIKGSKRHMSGKFGGVINHEMGPEFSTHKEFIRRNISKSKILKALDNGIINFTNYEYEKAFRDVLINEIDIRDEKNHVENSKLQGILFAEYFERFSGVEDEKTNMSERDMVIANFIKYGRSESSWSAPHMLLK